MLIGHVVHMKGYLPMDMFSSGVVSWSSKKQPTIALSTVEAKHMAASNATKEAIWLQVLLEDLGYPQLHTTVIHTDNQGCIALAQNPVAHSWAKHIDIWHHFLCKCIERKEIDLSYCSTKDMVADIFMKALPHEAFTKFCSTLGVSWEWRPHQVGVMKVHALVAKFLDCHLILTIAKKNSF